MSVSIDIAGTGPTPAAAAPRRAAPGPLARALRAAGGFTAALVTIGLLGVALVARALDVAGAEWAVGVTLSAVAASLVAGVASRLRTMLRRPALLVFHVALVALLAAAVWGRLVHYRATFGVAAGLPVRLGSVEARQGPLAPEWLSSIVVSADDLRTRYAFGRHTAEASARVALLDPAAPATAGAVSTEGPIDHRGLRLHATPRRGFAAVLGFHRPARRPERGVVYFPEYRDAHEWQAQELRLPGSDAPFVAELRLPASLLREDAPWSIDVPAGATLRLRSGAWSGPALAPGQGVPAAEGIVELSAIRPYGVFVATYDPSAPVVLALALVAFAALAWHYAAHAPRRRTGP